jgi:uncharacterized protein
MEVITPFAKPLYVMLKPVGARCNLACSYCYYQEKEMLYAEMSQQVMSENLLERFTREYIQSQTMPQVLFTWHGGEPLMRPLAFYRKAIELQRKYGKGRIIDNCIQTNGTLLTDDWCRFFKENNWLVGISIDGPQEFHDAYRRNRHGLPSFAQVMKGIELLEKHGVEWNAMAVVNRLNVEHPLEFYRLFQTIDCRYIQFTPIVERIVLKSGKECLAHVGDKENWRMTDASITSEQWGEFLCTLFDEWVQKDVGYRFVQLFDATLANWVGEEPGVCSMARSCGKAAVMEFNGDVYTCDHFVFPEYRLGNIYRHSLVEMLYGDKQQAFGVDKWRSLPVKCRQCKYLFACNGECPKNRFYTTSEGEEGLNYLCKGYYRFFEHVAPYMEYMKRELLAERAPSNIMNAIKENKW